MAHGKRLISWLSITSLAHPICWERPGDSLVLNYQPKGHFLGFQIQSNLLIPTALSSDIPVIPAESHLCIHGVSEILQN